MLWMVAGLGVGYLVGGAGFAFAVLALIVPLSSPLRDRLLVAGLGLAAMVVGASLVVWSVL